MLSVGIAGGLADLPVGSVVLPVSWFHHGEQIWITEGSQVSPVVPMPYITPGYDCLMDSSQQTQQQPNRFISANYSFKVSVRVPPVKDR
jgi:hypothetical protein